MTEFTFVKTLHVGCALLSISGFVARGILKLRNSALLQQRWLRISPHVVDALLLASAITLVVQQQLNILQQSWLLAKLAALVIYIALGLITLRFARTNAMRLASFILAIVTFGYIVLIANTRNAMIIM